MSKFKPPCAQKDFFPAMRLGAKKFVSSIDSLSAHKSKYALPFFNQFNVEIDAADVLPDHAARVAQVRSLKIDIVAQRQAVLQYNVSLESYIRDAFDSEKHDIMYEAAGNNYWDKAKGGDSNSVQALITSMVDFTTKRKVELEANKNMPTTFLADLTAAGAAFNKTNSDLEDAKAAVPNSKGEKNDACNAVFAKFNAISMDAQGLKDADKEWGKQFTFTTFLDQVRNTKNAGISGKVTDETGKIPIENATITIKGFDKVLETDDKGRYESPTLKEGTFSLVFEADGFETETIADAKVKTGVVTRVNVKMKAVENGAKTNGKKG